MSYVNNKLITEEGGVMSPDYDRIQRFKMLIHLFSGLGAVKKMDEEYGRKGYKYQLTEDGMHDALYSIDKDCYINMWGQILTPEQYLLPAATVGRIRKDTQTNSVPKKAPK